MDISVIVVSYNTKDLLERCLSSIQEAFTGFPQELEGEVCVIDNASRDETLQMLGDKFPQVRLIANKENRGFAAANNQGIRQTKGKYILFLNPDAFLLPGSLQKMYSFLKENEKVGIVAPKILNPDHTLQFSIRRFPSPKLLFYSAFFLDQGLVRTGYNLSRQVEQPMGACMLARRTAIEEAGEFDERFFMFFEEVDLCYRLKKCGWKIFYLSQAKVVHHGGKAITQVQGKMNLAWQKSRYNYFQKHYKLPLMGLLVIALSAFPYFFALSILVLLVKIVIGK